MLFEHLSKDAQNELAQYSWELLADDMDYPAEDLADGFSEWTRADVEDALLKAWAWEGEEEAVKAMAPEELEFEAACALDRFVWLLPNGNYLVGADGYRGPAVE